MDQMHIKEFLNQFSVGELARKGILRGRTRLLTGQSVFPLIGLMTTNDVSRLEAAERNWFLTSDGEFRNPLSTEAKSGKFETLDSFGNVFNEQNTSINPYYERSGIPEPGPDEDSEGLSFGQERDLQRALRANIEQLEPGLRITDGGVERTVEAGRIDVTAEDSNGSPVIIELKAGKAELASIGQLLSYMASADIDSSRPVRGILVANEFDYRLVVAAKAVPNISLKSYSIQFSFCDL